MDENAHPIEPAEWCVMEDVTLCTQRLPWFRNVPAAPGLYRLNIGGQVYIGHASDLRRRLQEYRNPTDDFGENYRRYLIVQAGGARLWLMTGDAMNSNEFRLRIEQIEIKKSVQDGWPSLNRGAKRGKAFYKFKMEHLEKQLAEAARAYAEAPDDETSPELPASISGMVD